MATTYNVRYVDVDADAGGDGTTAALTGGTCAYKSLNIWESARDANLTAGDGGGNYVVERAICGSAHANHTADTTAVEINGWTTSANSYVDVRTDSSNRAGCSWDTGKYRLSVANSSVFRVAEEFVRLDGLQLERTETNANAQNVLSLSGASGASPRISNCYLRTETGAVSYWAAVLALYDADVTAAVWNCIAHHRATIANTNNATVTCAGATASLYSCTVIGGRQGVRCASGTLTIKNCYAGNSDSEDFVYVGGTFAKTNCASEDSSATDTGANESATNCVASVAYDTDTFVNVTAGSEDFRLAADGLSPLQGAGVDTSGESAPLNFTVDIEGDTRDATWDIGADAWVEAGLSPAILRRRLPWATHLRM